jgi:hypothetical protein
VADDLIEDQEFETPPAPLERAVVTPTFRTELLEEAARVEREQQPPPAPALPASPPSPPVASPTLAELYVNQGFVEKAVEVYRELLQRDPGNEKAAQRLAELQVVAPTDPVAARRRQVEQTIARLEGFLAAVKRG